MNNPLELLKMIQGTSRSESEKLAALAAMADAPGEDFQAQVRLPVQNELPAFKIGDGSLGSTMLGLDYGVPAPVPGQNASNEPSIGQMLIGER